MRTVRTPTHNVRSLGQRVEVTRKHHAPVPPFNGRHLWIVIGMWKVQQPARSEHILDMENLITIDGPGCYWCEQPWTPTIGAHCPGDASTGLLQEDAP